MSRTTTGHQDDQQRKLRAAWWPVCCDRAKPGEFMCADCARFDLTDDDRADHMKRIQPRRKARMKRDEL